MTPDEVRAAQPTDNETCCGSTCDGSSFDDEDFYEAIDLLETCRTHIIRMVEEVGPHRKYVLEHLADDVKQFIDQFIVTADDSQDDQSKEVG